VTQVCNGLRVSRDGVLFSVAMTEGLDLRDDDARFCIIAKVPWPDMGDPYVQERMRRDDGWFANRAALAVVQSSGRSSLVLFAVESIS